MNRDALYGDNSVKNIKHWYEDLQPLLWTDKSRKMSIGKNIFTISTFFAFSLSWTNKAGTLSVCTLCMLRNVCLCRLLNNFICTFSYISLYFTFSPLLYLMMKISCCRNRKETREMTQEKKIWIHLHGNNL